MNYPQAQTAITLPERAWLVAQARELAEMGDEAVIVHIGVAEGYSLYCSAEGAPEATLIGVDLDISRFIATEQFTPFLIEGNSHKVHASFDLSVHFLFVDGDHSRASVTADMVGWLPLVVHGGVVAFHDYGHKRYHWCRGVSEAVDAWDWTGWQEILAAGSVRAFQKMET